MEHNPYAAPEAETELPQHEGGRPAGFWIRVGASIIDTILIAIVTMPLLFMLYGKEYFDSTVFAQGPLDILISYFLPAIAVVLFWIYRSATPGKILLGLKIVDANTGEKCTTGQLVLRYIGYYPAMIPLCIGFIWVAFDGRKQGWHDKIAKTLVVYGKG